MIQIRERSVLEQADRPEAVSTGRWDRPGGELTVGLFRDAVAGTPRVSGASTASVFLDACRAADEPADERLATDVESVTAAA